ncbi:MAG: SpoIID/LytB domain-containing protein [Candidatus Marinimicrobia bacterium]|nr:SpoIID/LytB domain-containing protein [Candidatus Neomarinimicrobiota bacterium]
MVKNIIEPIIRVGIILPEYKKTSIEIKLLNPQQYKINTGELSELLNIEIQSKSILINNEPVDNILIEPIKIDGEINPACVKTTADRHPIINSVPIGRGFHWQNEIQVQLPGGINIKNHNGYLFVINELHLEQYLPYVATSEMNPDCPPALLEAQTIAARSWLLVNRKVNHPELDIDVCNDDCCQRYQGVTNVPDQSLQTLQNTSGQVLLYNNKICDARYSKCCGGITESYENVWGEKPIPYLSSISDNPQPNDNLITTNDHESFINSSPPAFCSEKYISSSDIQKYLGKVDKSGSYYRWNISYSQEELTLIINNKLDLNAKIVKKLASLNRGFSGRITELKIDYIDKSDEKTSIVLNSEYDIRNALRKQFLYSSAITIEQKLDNNQHISSFKFNGAGWGHGVGLCQIGALGMALNGYSAEDILDHYFTDTTIDKIY